MLHATRHGDAPLITPAMHPDLADNINGPSLIEVPDWLPGRLGRYYLYFAHHQGRYIRLAYADALAGPWHIHEGGTLRLEQTRFAGHIASPDVHVDHERREILMFFHGCCMPEPPHQVTELATSRDGLAFAVQPRILSSSYWRAWRYGDWWYALVMPGDIYRGRDLRGAFERGPNLFTPQMRHAAVRVVGEVAQVIYTNAGDCPERLLLATIDMRGDWQSWQASEPVTLLAPERDYEGGGLPVVASRRGSVHEPVCQLRDPCVFEASGRTWLLYTVAGEWGIALAELRD